MHHEYKEIMANKDCSGNYLLKERCSKFAETWRSRKGPAAETYSMKLDTTRPNVHKNVHIDKTVE